MNSITVEGREFLSMEKAIEYAKIKSWTMEEGVRLNIVTPTPKDKLFRFKSELHIYHDGERVYFDDPELPNGYKKGI